MSPIQIIRCSSPKRFQRGAPKHFYASGTLTYGMRAAEWDAIADHYHEQIISPLRESTYNPLWKHIDRMRVTKIRCLELGCGTGELLADLANRFESVEGFDFSARMVERAKDRTRQLQNVHVRQGDMRRLQFPPSSFDAVITVNSLLAKSERTINGIVKNIFQVLRPGGMFLGILPAMEPYIYQRMLAVDYGRRQSKSQTLDFSRGIIDFDGSKQKAFYRFELGYRFGRAGFGNFSIERVPYSWKAWKEAGQPAFRKESPPWDWFLACQKPVGENEVEPGGI